MLAKFSNAEERRKSIRLLDFFFFFFGMVIIQYFPSSQKPISFSNMRSGITNELKITQVAVLNLRGNLFSNIVL